jgi:hypothetical protein
VKRTVMNACRCAYYAGQPRHIITGEESGAEMAEHDRRCFILWAGFRAKWMKAGSQINAGTTLLAVYTNLHIDKVPAGYRLWGDPNAEPRTFSSYEQAVIGGLRIVENWGIAQQNEDKAAA